MCTLAARACTPTPVALMWLLVMWISQPSCGAHRVAVELQVAVVDVQQRVTLADDRLVAALERGTRDARIAHARRGNRRGGRSGLDAVAGTGLDHLILGQLRRRGAAPADLML